jgi:hypothetical protein
MAINGKFVVKFNFRMLEKYVGNHKGFANQSMDLATRHGGKIYRKIWGFKMI